MKKLIAAAALLSSIAAAPASAQVNLNFEGTGAPCLFASTTFLTTFYSGQGVTFSGTGSLLNQCGNWPTGSANSGTDFIGYNTRHPGSSPSDLLTFNTTQNSFSVYLGSATGYNITFYLGNTFAGAIGGSLSSNSWTQVGFAGNFTSVQINGTGSLMQLDDLVTTSNTVPEPSSVALVAAGLLGVVAVRRRRRAI